MRIPGRRWTGCLVLSSATPEETEIDYISPATPFLAVLPKARGLYPLKEFTQLQLNLGVWAMPAGATQVLVTLVKFRGWLIPADASSFDVGSIATGTPRFEMFADQYEQVDAVDSLLDPFPATIKVTGPAPILVLNGQNYSVSGLTPGNGGGSFNYGLTDDFAGFLVTDNAVEQGAPGNFTISVTLGSN